MTHSAPVALITGGAKRVGASIARHLHAHGYDIVIHYRNSEMEARSLQSDLESLRPDSTLCLRADLADLGRLPGLVDSALAHFGRLDALINNASSFYPTPIQDARTEHWNDLFASNVQAPFFLAQAAAQALSARQGCILNLVDLYAAQPLAGHSLYCMAKAALSMMTLALAKELAPLVRVNGIAPGAVLWPESGKSAQEQALLISRTPLQRAGRPEDIAGAALFLLRDAPFVTGQILRVDGGRSIGW